MASQIYSRYIPPSKAKKSSTTSVLAPPQPTTSQHTSQPSSQPTPPSIQSDASTTYARYVPPPKDRTKSSAQIPEPPSNAEASSPPSKRKHAEVEDAPRGSSKRRKDTEASEELNTKEQDITDDSQDPATEPTEESVSVSKKTKQHKPLLDEANASEHEQDKRHKKLIDKRNKSLRRAEKAIEVVGDATEEPVPAEVEELHDLVPLPQPEPVPEPTAEHASASMPSWLANPIRISPTSAVPFTELGISDDVATCLRDKGFKEAFAVQAAVLPLLLPGSLAQDGDVLVSAATGSGKTMAYVLPMAENLSRHRVTRLRGLIVLPTRELVAQAKEVFEICTSVFPQRRRLRIGVAVGNESFKAEQNALMDSTLVYDPQGYQKQRKRANAKWEGSEYGSDGEICDDEVLSPLPNHIFDPAPKVDVLICTPGRLVEHLKSTPGFTLDQIQWLVVDEADKLLDQSFQQWLDVVMARLKRPRKVILSATMTRDIGQLNDLKLYRPKLVVVEKEEEISNSLFLPQSLTESAIKVDDEGVKPLYLLEILKREGLIPGDDESLAEDSSNGGPHGALIFTKSNETAVRLGRLVGLLEPKLFDKLGTLTATTRSSVRKRALKNFESGKLSILIASDLVSRGLDLTNLAHVINYDVPTSVTSYVHRVGRTARAGKAGHAWTLFTSTEGRWIWNEIGRAEGLRRDGKLERVNINADIFQKDRERYEEVLETLGREADGNPVDD